MPSDQILVLYVAHAGVRRLGLIELGEYTIVIGISIVSEKNMVAL